MTREEAIERVKSRFDKWALDEEDLAALQALGLVTKESEDERIRKWLIEMVEELKKANPTNVEHNGNCREAITYLERQKEQKPVEWSEEDEKMLRTIFDSLETYASNGHPCLKRVIDDEISWLKSLRTQHHWKPSEEQMRAVFDASERNDGLGSVLRNLYNDLKKL